MGEKNASELDPATGEAMQMAFDVKCTVLDMSLSTTAGHLLCSALDLRRVETTKYLKARVTFTEMRFS
jgi:hypothetical protein